MQDLSKSVPISDAAEMFGNERRDLYFRAFNIVTLRARERGRCNAEGTLRNVGQLCTY